MLSITYYERFKGNDRCLLVTGDSAAYNAAFSYFAGKKNIPLVTDKVFEHDPVAFEMGHNFVMTEEECRSLAHCCKELSEREKPAHIYFEIESWPDITVILSFGEYTPLSGARV